MSFRYPDSERWLLDGLDLTLRAGKRTALVGLNWAGKTTLVKLLCRLYDPTSGVLSVDGADLRAFDAGSWSRQVAVVFRDFNRYELSVRDNIAFDADDVDEGFRVAADGTHAELLALGGSYADLYHAQADQFADDEGADLR